MCVCLCMCVSVCVCVCGGGREQRGREWSPPGCWGPLSLIDRRRERENRSSVVAAVSKTLMKSEDVKTCQKKRSDIYITFFWR